MLQNYAKVLGTPMKTCKTIGKQIEIIFFPNPEEEKNHKSGVGY